MIRTMLKSKIHRATVTEADLNYIGSITIDQELMEAANIWPNEKVQIVDNNNGSRFETYAIAGEKGSGVICLNGAAARMVHKGDVIIIISYGMFTDDEARRYRPDLVFVDEQNRITSTRKGSSVEELS